MLKGYRAWLWLTLLCAALYIPGMAAMPSLDRDESRFVQASRQMVETGDPIRIRFHTIARNKKPAGIYWLQSLSVAAFSEAESTALWPYRIPSALGALIAVLFTFALGCLFLDRRTAFLGGALTASCLLLVGEAHIAKTDAMLLATIMAAQFALARMYFDGLEKRDPGWPIALLFWAAMGTGLLIKGPLTPLVVGLTLVGLWVTDRRARLWQALKIWAGLPLMILIAAPWFVAIILSDSTFIQESAGRDFLGKLVSAQEKHGFPPGFYTLLLTATLAPASLFLWPALIWGWRHRREAPVRFCLLWVIPFWVILEIIPTKLPHYVLPVYPALALLIALAVKAADGGGLAFVSRWPFKLLYLGIGVMIVGFTVAVFFLPIVVGEGVIWAAAIPVLVAVGTSFYTLPRLWRGDVRPALIMSIIATPFVMGPIFSWVLPNVNSLWPSRESMAVARASVPAGKTVRFFTSGYTEPSAVFYGGTKIRFHEPADLARVVKPLKDWRAVVEDRSIKAFQKAASGLGLKLRQVGVVKGFNVGRTQWVRLTIFAPARQ